MPRCVCSNHSGAVIQTEATSAEDASLVWAALRELAVIQQQENKDASGEKASMENDLHDRASTQLARMGDEVHPHLAGRVVPLAVHVPR